MNRLVQCLCWCMTDIVLVTRDDVWNGRTDTCGRECCTPNIIRKAKK